LNCDHIVVPADSADPADPEDCFSVVIADLVKAAEAVEAVEAVAVAQVAEPVVFAVEAFGVVAAPVVAAVLPVDSGCFHPNLFFDCRVSVDDRPAFLFAFAYDPPQWLWQMAFQSWLFSLQKHLLPADQESYK